MTNRGRSTPGRTSGFIVLVGVLLTTVCGPATDGTRSFTTRDSAGVVLAENAGASLQNAARWSIDEEPLLDIGTLEGDTARELYRASAATRQEDGRIALVSEGTEIRFFGPEGDHLGEVGRSGEGPGEFGFATELWPYRTDSLLVWDVRLQRVTVLDQQGAVGRVTDVEIPSFNPRMLGTFGDGSFLLRSDLFVRPGEEIRTQRSLFFHHRRDGTVTDTVASYPNFRSVPLDLPGDRSMFGGVAFGPRTVATLGDAAFYVGTGRGYRIDVRAPDGSLRRVIRLDRSPEPVTEEDRSRWREQRLAGADGENERRDTRAILDQTPVAETFPPYDRMHADRTGHLWVRDYRKPWQEGPDRWLVFDPAGRLVATAQLPAFRFVFEIGRHYVIGLALDEMDVEHVRLHRLHRTDTGGTS